MSRSKGRTRQQRRRKIKRLPSPLILIVCEGQETEPRYFERLRQKKRIQKERIRVLSSKDCGCTHPIGLVRAVISSAREIKRKEQLVYDQCWVVFDRDEHLSYNDAIQLAQAKNVNVGFSNPSFELWYLLHFQKQMAALERDEVLEKIKRHIPNYDKAMPNLYDL